MTKLKKHLMLFFLFICVPSFLFSCSHKKPTDISEAEAEVWELKLTGDDVGTLKLLLARVKIGNDIFSIAGRISGSLKDHRAGSGIADYKLEGTIEKGIFQAIFSGSSNMDEGFSPTSGSMNGTVSKSRGSGQYSVSHAFGSSHGNYIMKKIDSD